MSEPARGLVIAHAALAAALVEAARQISGAPAEALTPLSNEGRGPEALAAAIDAAAGDGPLVVFSDLPSGSCAFAARRFGLRRSNTAVVCGVNLAMLLDFAFNRELPLEQLVARLVAKGRDGITGAYTEEESADADRTLSR
jgi:mannose/fructose-specific phosphotransferase system component IIA